MNSETTEITETKEVSRYHSCQADGHETVGNGDEALAPQTNYSFRGWILYDGDCLSCTASARRFDRIFRRCGFLFLPLQTNWVMQRLGLEPGVPLEEMRVLTHNGRDIGGADAVIFLARQIWWTWPCYVLAKLPGVHGIIDRVYRWIAAHRSCDHIACDLKERRSLDRRLSKSAVGKPPLLEEWPAWIPLVVLPVLMVLFRDHVAPWQFMWLMAGAIFLGCKWLTFSRARRQVVYLRVGRTLGYFFLWPGMDAEKFLSGAAVSLQTLPAAIAKERLSGKMPDRAGTMPALPITAAIGKTLLGVVLLFGVARFAHQSLLAGWIGMMGMILIFHFGLFHLLAIGWRAAGIGVEPIMEAPLRSKSVGDFWGRRWNGAFNRIALDFVFRPIVRKRGRGKSSRDPATILPPETAAATTSSRGKLDPLPQNWNRNAGRVSCLRPNPRTCDLIAGRRRLRLTHSVFFLQGTGILTERALPQIRGRIFAIVIIAVPAFWLFHPPFVRNVILPFMKAIGAL